MVYNLSEGAGIHHVFMAGLRNRDLQQNRVVFRKNMERLGQILSYEISRRIPYQEEEVGTPLGTATHRIPSESPVLCCILRAGIPFFNGFLDYFSESDAGFFGAYRGTSRSDHSFDIQLDYEALPPMEGKTVILIDPMLATGKSMLKAAEVIISRGKPHKLIIACLIASPEGIATVEAGMPDADIWTIAIDEGLNSHAYIIPGLGDAGDLSFGPKQG
jgi:uracil phosphoribosyltransferase